MQEWRMDETDAEWYTKLHAVVARKCTKSESSPSTTLANSCFSFRACVNSCFSFRAVLRLIWTKNLAFAVITQ
jgi:hypothetical protein